MVTVARTPCPSSGGFLLCVLPDFSTSMLAGAASALEPKSSRDLLVFGAQRAGFRGSHGRLRTLGCVRTLGLLDRAGAIFGLSSRGFGGSIARHHRCCLRVLAFQRFFPSCGASPSSASPSSASLQVLRLRALRLLRALHQRRPLLVRLRQAARHSATATSRLIDRRRRINGGHSGRCGEG